MKRLRTIATTYLIWLVPTILLVGVLCALFGRAVIEAPLEDETRERLESLCDRISRGLNEHLWNLDDEKIGKYLNSVPLPDSILQVRVLNEYREPVYVLRIREEPDRISVSHDVLGHGQRIGYVEIDGSRSNLRTLRAAIFQATVMTSLLGLIVSVVVMTLIVSRLIVRPLRGVSEKIRSVAGGDYTAHLPPARLAEIEVIVEAVNRMAREIAERTAVLQEEIAQRKATQQALESLRDDLERQVADRTHELSDTNEALRREAAERRAVEEELTGIVNREQKRIGHDLHDTLGQQLAGTAYLCGSLLRRLRQTSPEDAETVEQIAQHLRDAVMQTRAIAHGLSPVEVADDGLRNALSVLADDMSRLYGVRCRMRHEKDFRVHSNEVSTHLYRIALEAINNAKRHGHATEIDISLLLENGVGMLIISDNGRGLSPQRHTKGIGMRVMRYRADLVGGTFSVHSEQGKGTRITVTFRDRPDGDVALPRD